MGWMLKASPILNRLRTSLAAIHTDFFPAIEDTARQLATQVITALHDAAPKGEGGGGEPPPGDMPGALADSFRTLVTADSVGGSISIEIMTVQPQKLTYVRYGTGIYGPSGQPIRPVVKRALYWSGARHPVKSVRGMKPNDFVTPVLDEQQEQVLNELTDMAVQILSRF